MPDTHQRFGFLPSCFANERKHKPIGQLATSLLNKKNFETNLLEQALAKEICHLDQPQLFKDGVHLVDPISASKKSSQTLSNLRPRGGRKLALQNGKVEGSEVGKNTALSVEAGVKSPLYVALCSDPPAREEREERRKDERQRGERERERRER